MQNTAIHTTAKVLGLGALVGTILPSHALPSLDDPAKAHADTADTTNRTQDGRQFYACHGWE